MRQITIKFVENMSDRVAFLLMEELHKMLQDYGEVIIITTPQLANDTDISPNLDE
jgi:hypothetical protein